MRRRTFIWSLPVIGSAGLLSLNGCGGAEETVAQRIGPSETGQPFIVKSAPSNPQNVHEVLANAKDGEEVVAVGRVGGRVNPWIEGLAAFNFVDVSQLACSELPGDPCPTPWDFCCAPDLKENRILVQVPDASGEPIAEDAKTMLGLMELDTLVISGKVLKDDNGNVILLLSQAFIK
ncbi:MAG: hypothetical protein ACJZ8O_03020 [Pirellulaceae bacterium]